MQPADTDPACPRCGRSDCTVYPAFVAAVADLYHHFGNADARGMAHATIRIRDSFPEPRGDAPDA